MIKRNPRMQLQLCTRAAFHNDNDCPSTTITMGQHFHATTDHVMTVTPGEGS